MQFGVNVSTTELLVHRLRDTGRVVDRPQREHQHITTPRQDRAIYLAHLCNCHVTATETALTTVGNHNHHIHPKTVRKRLHEFGLRARRPYMSTFRREHFSPDFEGPFRSSHQLSKSSAREKNQVQKNLDLHFAINISGNSPFGTSALKKNAERYEW